MYENLLRDKRFKETLARCARDEGVAARDLAHAVATGRAVITQNNARRLTRPCAIGRGLSTKINVNIGTSPERPSLSRELKKLDAAIELGADAVMDLSLGGDLKKNRRAILDHAPMPVGTVPIYEAAVRIQKKRGSFRKMEAADLLEVLREHAADGVDFVTIHCGVNRKSLDAFLKNPRLMGVVSRGGALLVNWMCRNKKENPFFERFDEVLKIAASFNVTLSLGDGMRPGSILDATDTVQLSELRELGELVHRCRRAGVQVIVEGPGHVPLNQIEENIRLEKKICDEAPFYVLGPLVTDIGLGYDHISGAIGGALAATHGADFLCYLTPAEHVSHPSVADAREGIVASKIAAHAADLAKGLPAAWEKDARLSRARQRRSWNEQIRLCLDPRKAAAYHKKSRPKIKETCTMCGEFCSIRLIDKSRKPLFSRSSRGD